MCAGIDYDLWEFEELLESMQCDVNNIGVIIIVQNFPYCFSATPIGLIMMMMSYLLRAHFIVVIYFRDVYIEIINITYIAPLL